MGPIKHMPPLDFRFGHSFAYFQHCACAKTNFWHLAYMTYNSLCQHMSITIEISAIPGALIFGHFWSSNWTLWIAGYTCMHYLLVLLKGALSLVNSRGTFRHIPWENGSDVIPGEHLRIYPH